MRICLRHGALALLFAARLAAATPPQPVPQDDAAMLYPRRPSSENQAADKTPSGGTAAAAAVVALGGAGGWVLWRRWKGGFSPGPRGAQRLAVDESRSLGNRQYLVVASYGSRKFLLAVCPGRIRLLSPLDGDLNPPSA